MNAPNKVMVPTTKSEPASFLFGTLAAVTFDVVLLLLDPATAPLILVAPPCNAPDALLPDAAVPHVCFPSGVL